MAKQIQTIRRHPTNCLSVFDHLWGWHLKDQEVFLREIVLFINESYQGCLRP